MSKCNCKYAKWFPHNWLCLKGLAILFLVFFYISGIYALYVIEEIIRNFNYIPRHMLTYLIQFAMSLLLFSVFSLTVAKALKVLRKIKQAVVPCECAAKEEPAKEEVKEETK